MQKQDRFTNILHFIRILLVCPVVMGHVEHQFAYIKHFIGDWIHGLGCDTLEDLLRIASKDPEPSEYDTTAAVDRWRSSSSPPRHPNTQLYRPRKHKVHVAVIADSGSDTNDIAKINYCEDNHTDVLEPGEVSPGNKYNI